MSRIENRPHPPDLSLAEPEPEPEDDAAPAKYVPRPRDGVVHLGLTDSGRIEAAALRGGARVTALGTSDPTDHVARANGRGHDVSRPEGLARFVADLGLAPEQSAAVQSALERADIGGRDELARIAAIWAQAERGERMPTRLVLSGHASGTGVHGDGGTVSAAALGRLAAAMPRAARNVEDLHVAACYSGHAGRAAEWREVFPNLRTFWGYVASAPSGRAAGHHLRLWERGTRGDAEAISPELARGTLRGGNVAVWTASSGWRSAAAPPPLDVARAQWSRQQPTVVAYARGGRDVEDPHVGELRGAYSDLQTLLGHPDLLADERRVLEQDRAFVVRLLFFGELAPRFFHEHDVEIRDGFAALGEAVPDLGEHPRARVLELAADLERRVAELDAPPPAATHLRDLLGGLRDLSPDALPDHWIGTRWRP